MNNATNESAPLQIWLHEVVMTAKVSVDQLAPFRDMVIRWYHAGEPVWMAADSLRIAVGERENAIRIQKMVDSDSLRSILASCAKLIDSKQHYGHPIQRDRK